MPLIIIIIIIELSITEDVLNITTNSTIKRRFLTALIRIFVVKCQSHLHPTLQDVSRDSHAWGLSPTLTRAGNFNFNFKVLPRLHEPRVSLSFSQQTSYAMLNAAQKHISYRWANWKCTSIVSRWSDQLFSLPGRFSRNSLEGWKGRTWTKEKTTRFWW